jgi:mannitol-1-phosphate 5-dehydrogenase
MKAVHFGAGSIGRGFIALLLSQAGYEVQFVDVNSDLVSLLQQRKEYTVTLANDTQDTTIVKHITAIHGQHTDLVANAIADADLVTTAVGVSILKYIAESIAKGIELRLKLNPSPLHIIACENAIGGSTRLKELVYSYIRPDLHQQVDVITAFPDAAVDRIVPIQQHEDPLKVTVEPFFEWVVDQSKMINGGINVKGIHAVNELEPYIERKLFTVNTGHCCTAYHGYLCGADTIQVSLSIEDVRQEVEAVLKETGSMLIRTYGFDEQTHHAYIHKILERFANPYLTDDVIRVGRSPIRKLSPNDRMVRPVLLAHGLGIETTHLSGAMAAALCFDAAEDPEAVEIQRSLQTKGLSQTIEQYTSIPPDHPIHSQIIEQFRHFKNRYRRKV